MTKAARWSPEELATVVEKSGTRINACIGAGNHGVTVLQDPRPKGKSKLGSFKAMRDYLVQLHAAGIERPVLEYRFAPGRKWQADFAWPDRKLLVEFEGAVYVQGRHTRGKGFEDDCRKYNAAVLHGYRLLRITTDLIEDGHAFDVTEAAYFASVPAQ